MIPASSHTHVALVRERILNRGATRNGLRDDNLFSRESYCETQKSQVRENCALQVSSVQFVRPPAASARDK